MIDLQSVVYVCMGAAIGTAVTAAVVMYSLHSCAVVPFRLVRETIAKNMVMRDALILLVVTGMVDKLYEQDRDAGTKVSRDIDAAMDNFHSNYNAQMSRGG